MDASMAKRTQETLGKIIKKPPLTEKLLSKPPFRFLHDIITEVIKNTGFFKGLYTTEEMNSANVKEKDAKIIFLQKAIDCVVIANGASLSVRPSKIVAGQEAEKTNEFLQAIAKAVSSKKDSKDAVKKVLAGEKPGKSDSKKKETRAGSGSREREKSKDRPRDTGSAKADKEKKEVDSSRRRETSSKGSREDKRRREDSGRKDKDKERDKDRDRAERERERQQEREREREKEKEKERERATKKDEEPHVDDLDGNVAVDGNDEDGDVPPNRIPRPSSAKGQRRRPQDEAEDSLEGERNGDFGADGNKKPTEQMNGVMNDEDELPPQVIASRRMPRPSSARPAPPKMKKKQDELEEPAARIGSGKQVANVIVDNGKDDDEDDTFVVDDTQVQQNHIDSVPVTEATEEDGEHGGLVRKILETKKELEGSGPQESRPRPDRTAPLMSDAARRKERELAQKEIEKLRTSIQALTRSANPLGKIMDYIQEDMDSMQKELEMWRRENKEHAVALRREESITQTEVEPLEGQLTELGTEIGEMVDRISTVKCNILKNDEKIQKMLGSISFSSR